MRAHLCGRGERGGGQRSEDRLRMRVGKQREARCATVAVQRWGKHTMTHLDCDLQRIVRVCICELRILESPSGEQWRQTYSLRESLYLFSMQYDEMHLI